MSQLLGRMQRMEMQAQSSRMGAVEKSVGAGAGVYVLNRLLDQKYGRVQAPVVGSVDGNLFMAVIAGLSAAGEYATKPYLPSAIGRYGGGVAVDMTARGVVPVAAYSVLTGERPGWSDGAKQVAITYAGSTAGTMLASQFFG